MRPRRQVRACASVRVTGAKISFGNWRNSILVLRCIRTWLQTRLRFSLLHFTYVRISFDFVPSNEERGRGEGWHASRAKWERATFQVCLSPLLFSPGSQKSFGAKVILVFGSSIFSLLRLQFSPFRCTLPALRTKNPQLWTIFSFFLSFPIFPLQRRSKNYRGDFVIHFGVNKESVEN